MQVYLGLFTLSLMIALILALAGSNSVDYNYLEDTILQKELSGYAEYAKKVRYRLLPGIW